MKWKRLAAVAALVLVGLCIQLQITRTRLLVWQHHIEKGDTLDTTALLNKAGQDGFDCTYFTGRGFVKKGYWDSRDGLIGVDECPLLLGADE